MVTRFVYIYVKMFILLFSSENNRGTSLSADREFKLKLQREK